MGKPGSFVAPAGGEMTRPAKRDMMRFVHVFLVGYVLLVVGALAALWYGGVLQRVSPIWILISLVIAAGLGVMLSISAGKPEITRE